MKLLIFVVCCFAALSLVRCTTRQEIMMAKLKGLEGYLQEKQAMDELTSYWEQICPGSKAKLEDALDSIESCAGKIDRTSETSCSIIQNKLPKCLQPLMKVVKDCMPAKSKELPDFALDSFLQGVKYVCKTDGEHIFELGNTCIFKQTPALNICQRNMQMKLSRFDENGLRVDDVCSTLHYMKPCLKSHLELACGSPITREAFLQIYDAFTSKCKSGVSANEIDDTKEIRVNQLEDFS